MAYTFDEVLGMFNKAKERRPERWGGSDVYSFAKTMAPDDPMFGGVADDNWIQKGSRGLDSWLQQTGAPQASADFFGGLAKLVGQEQVGRDVGMGMPRMVANMAPLALGAIPVVGGPLALAGMAGMFGSETYAQTDSPVAGLLSGATAAAIPGVFRPGGQMGLAIARKYGLQGIEEGLVNMGTKEAPSWVPQLVPEGLKARLVEYLGGQTLAAGAMTAGAEAQSVAGGQGLFNPVTPEYLTGQVIGQLPFMALDAPRILKEASKDAAMVKKIERQPVDATTPEPVFTPSETEISKSAADEMLQLAKIIRATREGAQTDETRDALKALQAQLDRIVMTKKPSASVDENGNPLVPVEPSAPAPIVPNENVSVEPTAPELAQHPSQVLTTQQGKAIIERPDKKGVKWTLLELENGKKIFVASEKLTKEADGSFTFPERFLSNEAPALTKTSAPTPVVSDVGLTSDAKQLLSEIDKDGNVPFKFTPALDQLLQENGVVKTPEMTPAQAIDALRAKRVAKPIPASEDLFAQENLNKAKTNAKSPTSDAADGIVKTAEAKDVLKSAAPTDEELASKIEKKVADGKTVEQAVNEIINEVASDAVDTAQKDVVIGKAKQPGKKALANRARRQEQFGELVKSLPEDTMADIMTLYGQLQEHEANRGGSTEEVDYRVQGAILKFVETGKFDMKMIGNTGAKMDALDLQRLKWNMQKLSKVLEISKNIKANKDKIAASMKTAAKQARKTQAEPDEKSVLQDDGGYRPLQEGAPAQGKDVKFKTEREAKLMANQLNLEEQNNEVSGNITDATIGSEPGVLTGSENEVPQGGTRFKVKKSGASWRVEKHQWFDHVQYEEGGKTQSVDMSYGVADPSGEHSVDLEDLYSSMGWDDPKDSGMDQVFEALHHDSDEHYGASLWDITRVELDKSVKHLNDLSNNEILQLNNGEPLNVGRFRTAFGKLVELMTSKKQVDWNEVKRLIYSNDLNHPVAGKLLATFSQGLHEGTYVGENGRLYAKTWTVGDTGISFVGKPTMFTTRFMKNLADYRSGKNKKLLQHLQIDSNGTVKAENLLAQGKKFGLPPWEMTVLEKVVGALKDTDRVNIADVEKLMGEVKVEVRKLGEGALPEAVKTFLRYQHEWFDNLTEEQQCVVLVNNERGIALPEGSSPEFIKATQKYHALFKLSRETPYDGSSEQYSQIGVKVNMPEYVELLVRLPKKELQYDPTLSKEQNAQLARETPRAQFQGTHWGSEADNMIASVRGYVETRADGGRTFHVIEVQSDWAQTRAKEENRYKIVQFNDHFNVTDADGSHVSGPYETRAQAEHFTAPRTPNHPMLEVHESIGLKAAIQHALENGCDRIAVSDAKTAMMTEGHDKVARMVKKVEGVDNIVKQLVSEYGDAYTAQTSAERNFGKDWVQGKYVTVESNRSDTRLVRVDKPDNNISTFQPIAKAVIEAGLQNSDGALIPQEKGMTLAYDHVLPDTLSKMTGEKGSLVDYGQHQRVEVIGDNNDNLTFDDPEQALRDGEINQDQYNQIQEQKKVGSPIFKNRDGTPKSNITAREYSLSKLISDERRAGEITLIGENGETVHASNLYATPASEAPGMMLQGAKLFDKLMEAEGRHPDEIAPLKKVWMKLCALVPELEGTNMATFTTDGASNLKGLSATEKPWIALNLEQHSVPVTLQNFAHELGHQIHMMLGNKEGSLEMSQFYDNAVGFLGSLNQEQSLYIMKLAFESLPKEQRNDPNVNALLASNLDKPDEIIANLISVSMVNATMKPRVWRSMVEMMPKPLADLIFHVVDWAKSLTNAVRTTMGIGVQEFGGFRMEQGMRDFLTDFNRTLDGMYRTHNQVEQEVQRFLALDQFTPEGVAFLQGEDSPIKTFTMDGDRFKPSMYDGLSLMLGKKSNILEDTAVNLGWATRGWLNSMENWIMPVRHLAEKYPVARYAFGIPLMQQSYEQDLRVKFQSLLCTKPDGKGGFVKDPKATEFQKLLKSPRLQEIVSEILLDRNFKGEKYTPADDEAALAKLSPIDRLTVQHHLDYVDYAQTVWRQEDIATRVDGIQKAGAQIVLMKNRELPWTKAVEVANKLYEAVKSQDPAELQIAQQLLGADTMLDLYGFYRKANLALEDLQKFYESKKYYVTERRPGKFKVKFLKGETGGMLSASTYAEQQRQVERLQKDPTVSKVEALNPKDFNEFQALDEGFVQKLRAYEMTMQDNVMSLVPDEEIRAKIAPYLSVVDEYLKDKASLTTLVTEKKLHREFDPGREELNMVFNHMNFIKSSIKQMARRKARSDMGVQMLDKTVTADPTVVDLVKRNYANFQRPDTRLGTMMNSGNFLMYLAFNISNHIMEGAQWMVSLPSVLTEINAKPGNELGVIGSYRETLKAAKEVTQYHMTKKWSDPDIKALMDQAAIDIDHNLGSLSETISPDSLTLVNSLRLGQGMSIASSNDLLGNPVAMYGNAAKALYQIPSQFNTRVALVAGYKTARANGLSHIEAIDEARRINRLANFNEGKAGRPIGPYDNKTQVGRTAAQMMMSLQGYMWGMISTFVRQSKTAFSGRTDIPRSTRVAARKALVQIAATQFALAGGLGLPFAGSAIALIEQMFPELEPEKDLREWIAKLGGQDQEMGGLYSRLASDGLLNQITPFDFASRYGMSNVMGVSSMKGWSADQLLGPSISLMGSEFKAFQELMNGHMGQALENAVPLGFKNVIKMYRDDWKILDSKGNLMLDPTEAEKYGRAIGFAPTRLNNAYKAARMADRSTKIEAARSKREQDDLVELMKEGQFDQVKQIVAEKAAQDPTFDPNVTIRAITQKFLKGQMVADPSGGTATGAQTARLMGLTPTAPQQVQRLDAMTQLKQQLGAGRSLPKLHGNPRLRAMQADDLAAMGYFPKEDPTSVLGMY